MAVERLKPALQTVLQELNFNELTSIQLEAIPVLLQGKDVLGQAQTGSGKTAAFALPILNEIDLSRSEIQALILCPTRELAQQVAQEVRRFGRRLEGLHVTTLVGGISGREQAQSLEHGAHIAVGTPGRILDMLERGALDPQVVKTLVVDEADKMLEIGFQKELKNIFKTLPIQRQNVFFSATFPEDILELSRRYQKNAVHVKAKDTAPPAVIEQIYYEAREEDRIPVLMRVLQQHLSESTIVFCNTKKAVNEVLESLLEQGAPCAALHGELTGDERIRVMAMFKNRSYRILVATDVAARGLDVDNLELVVNYDAPLQPETYVHRIGRTGRAGQKGTAVTLLGAYDTAKLLDIQKVAAQKIVQGQLGFKNQHGLPRTLTTAVMKTLWLGAGRKDKLRAGDILGALTGQDKTLTGADIGKIDIQDHVSYAAITPAKADRAFKKLKDHGIKGKKVSVRILT